VTSPVTLIPLRCLRCETPIPANPEEVAWSCGQCRQGLLLDPSAGLVPLEIHYSAALKPDQTGKPYWVTMGKVHLSRETYAGSSAKIQQEVEAFWRDERMFVIPAFSTTLEALQSAAVNYLRQPPNLSEGPPGRFEPVTLSPDDLNAMAQFVVLAVEADRKDRLKSLDVRVELQPPVLWIFPLRILRRA